MKIEHLNLTNFRNYKELSIDFHDGLTILTGENAQGKTNILEAIFLLSLAKSHRTNHDQEMITWNEDYAKVVGQITTKNSHFPLEIILNSKGKIAKYNYIDQKRLSQFIGKLNVILFSPEDMQIVKGSPSLRRKFLDTELGQTHPIYLQNLLEYHRILKQRNSYLKQAREKNSHDPVYLEILTDQLVEAGSRVINYRIEFVKNLEKIAQPLHYELSNERDLLSMVYKSSTSKVDYEKKDLIEDQLEELFKSSTQREIDQGITLYGPHRDDLIFYINDNLAQQFASQGQQRTIILSLKLAELDLVYAIDQDYPVLLLDDVLSELDDRRQFILMSKIEGKVQTILTTASVENIHIQELKNSSIIQVKKGKVL
ncbi:DNA replication/repair protein RecF [Facklamia miroungae]|uniref:DNA replication and repair protein RecF n=1 Tax=Facklamia miroungae TaxID=120956 RepID=A0A1G7SZ72_9LACT|nr:DNA replication/repair protein RecF [Facklamia miroungae]NKZ29499.1 DNA replication/repair protein RecF [Facklamia miroungae]SDG27620.1 DNA replication and repair protein RecF [Facklamia miroungae]